MTSNVTETTTIKSYLHENDGVDHINIHFTIAKTELGRLLSHFQYSPFNHPDYGPFKSMEAFWWWLSGTPRDDRLRSLCGNKAKTKGRLQKNRSQGEDFQKEILIANYYRIDQSPELKTLLIESELPFAMYYIYGEKKQIQIEPMESRWLSAIFETLRELFKNNISLDDYLHSSGKPD